MSNITINTAVLHSDQFKSKLDRADRRCRTGARFVLEALDIPLPETLVRKPTGIKPGKAIAAAFAADTRDHRDTTFTASGERRVAPDGRLPPSRFNSSQ